MAGPRKAQSKSNKDIKRKTKKRDKSVKSFGKGKLGDLSAVAVAPKKTIPSMKDIERAKAIKKAAERRAKRNVASTGKKTTRKES